MRKLLFNLHLYLALVLGLFVVIIGVTGSLIAFESDLDRLTNPELFDVRPQGPSLSAAGMLAGARQAYPGRPILSLRLPPNASTSASFTLSGGGEVFLNPYSGAVMGSRQADTWLNVAHQLHMRLLMGKSGDAIVAFLTGILLFLVASGIYLWWPLKRSSIKWSASARRIHFDLHNTAGIYSAAILLVLGCSGLGVFFAGDIERSLHARNGTVKIEKKIPSVPQADVTAIGPNEAIQTALRTLPGTAPLSISVPMNPTDSFLVAVRYPEDLTPGGRSWVTVDRYSGKAVGMQNSRTVAWATRAIILTRSIHTGDIFGYFSKIVMSIACLLLVSQAVTGYYLWLKRARAVSS